MKHEENVVAKPNVIELENIYKRGPGQNPSTRESLPPSPVFHQDIARLSVCSSKPAEPERQQ